MSHLYLIVDGELSGAGLRNAIEGGYVNPKEIGISQELQQQLAAWLLRYEDAHFHQYEDEENNALLDREGVEIAKKLKTELPQAKIRYFSSAYMREVRL